jgi:hypothetical protein
MSLSVNDHFGACSCASLDGVSRQSPEQCLLQYIKTLNHKCYNSADKKYEDNIRYGWYVHVFFVGPEHKGWTVNRDYHYSQFGSCDALADYIEEHKLGPVVRSPGRWNHRHAGRVPGQGDLVAYVWSPDPDALEKWYKEHKK